MEEALIIFQKHIKYLLTELEYRNRIERIDRCEFRFFMNQLIERMKKISEIDQTEITKDFLSGTLVPEKFHEDLSAEGLMNVLSIFELNFWSGIAWHGLNHQEK